MTGFLFRQRTFGVISNNNATSFEHSYQRFYDDEVRICYDLETGEELGYGLCPL